MRIRNGPPYFYNGMIPVLCCRPTHLNDSHNTPSPRQHRMETVWQVWLQYPLAFEFNDSYLAAIVAHSYSAMSGTFLTNSEKEREEGNMPELTSSLWTHLLSDETLPGFLNPKYGQQQPPASSGGEEDKEKEGDRKKKKEGTTLHKFATPTTILQPNPKQVQLWMQVHFPFFEFPKNS